MDATQDLSHQLWTLRELLEQLLFKLDVQGLVLRAGKIRWVPFVTAEIEAVMDAIDEVEAARNDATQRLTSERGFRHDLALSELIESVGQPWAALLGEHRSHLIALRSEIDELSRANHELANSGISRTREMLASLGDSSVDVYDPRGLTTPLLTASLRLDRTF